MGNWFGGSSSSDEGENNEQNTNGEILGCMRKNVKIRGIAFYSDNYDVNATESAFYPDPRACNWLPMDPNAVFDFDPNDVHRVSESDTAADTKLTNDKKTCTEAGDVNLVYTFIGKAGVENGKVR